MGQVSLVQTSRWERLISMAVIQRSWKSSEGTIRLPLYFNPEEQFKHTEDQNFKEQQGKKMYFLTGFTFTKPPCQALCVKVQSRKLLSQC